MKRMKSVLVKFQVLLSFFISDITGLFIVSCQKIEHASLVPYW